ncbi:serine threonine- kinase CDL1-like [Olea europaea subsp. europaea]|uniref:Serine threonine- kinase CDL1-like n=1 Tax=Olea europaea subsp. europaea TaxID=158383 RepID=A0A8S0RZC2_OLEEU|nr:serine threonine- kinase CDL1-like [Olea europaea subsp. europaea]
MEFNATAPAPASTGKSHSHNAHNIIHSSSNLSSLVIIVTPVIIIIFLLAVIVTIVMLRRLRFARSRSNVNNSSCLFSVAHTTIDINASPDIKSGCLCGTSLGRMPQYKSRGVQVFTLKEMDLATDNFSEANMLDNGGYGVVYRGILIDGTVIAIKVLCRQGRQGERAFRLEVDLLSRLHCPYLVQLVGYCADLNHRQLVFEYMPNASLHKHLHQRRTWLNWGIRLRIALDCARALEFLHEHTSPSVIHRNLKCSNILLDQNFRAKLTGFGLAKIGSDKLDGLISTCVLGTTGYLAPEYASTGKLTTKSDVYSYGVILLELLTGRVPVDTNRPPGEHILVSWALPRLTKREKADEMVDPALKGQYSRTDLIQVAAIAAMCVQTEADYRPLMTDVVQSLIPLVKKLSTLCPSSLCKNDQTVRPRS